MNRRCAALGFSLVAVLALAPVPAVGIESGARPLQLGLAATPTSSAHARSVELRAPNSRVRASTTRRMPAFTPAEPSLTHRALQGVLDPPEQLVAEAAIGSPQPAVQFRFKRQGPALRDLSASYKDMCANVSDKIWDEPNGRRIKFDIAGKPGVAVVIPIR